MPWYAIETAVKTLDPEVQCVVDFAHKQGFVDLYIMTAGCGEGSNFKVKRIVPKASKQDLWIWTQ